MTRAMDELIIRDYEPGYAEAYKQLNLAWISKYFRVEEHDLEQLEHPEERIISRGGHILFAVINGQIAGTCALIKTHDREYELAKMAVSPEFQGQQIGQKLGLAILERARAIGARRVWLESNRRLVPALSLYRKLGFGEIPVGDTPYARADIKMEMLIE